MNSTVVVYIGSTGRHLRDARAAVERMLRRMSQSGFAELGIVSTPPDVAMSDRIAALDRASVYIGLFAQDDGAIDQDAGLSWSELEYRYACRRRVPRLIYLEEGQPLTGAPTRRRHAEQAVKPSPLQDDLRQEQFVYAFSSAESLALRIAADLQELLRREHFVDAAAQNAQQTSSQITIFNSQGIVIGDHARVEQHFNRTEPSFRPSSQSRSDRTAPGILPRRMPLERDTWLQLGGRDYLVQQVLQEQLYSNSTTRLAIARDETFFKGIVLLKQFEIRDDDGVARNALKKAATDAEGWKIAARGRVYLPIVLDIQQSDHMLWVVTEWIKGASLRQLYPLDRLLPHRDAINVLVNCAIVVCNALHALHKQDVMHLNLTPDHIVHADEGRGYVLVDPTLGRYNGSDSSITRDFRAPEQTHKRPRRASLSAATDIYGLAATLYNLMTHRMPAHVNGVLVRPCTVNPAIPPRLDAALMRALEVHPRERFADAERFQSELRLVMRTIAHP